MTTIRQKKAIHPKAQDRRAGKRPRRWCYGGGVVLLGLVLLGGGQPPSSAPPAAPPAAPQPMGQVAPTAAAASPMDAPVRLIREAQEAYKNVRDYTCTLIKQERNKGVLPPNNVIEMKVRSQPFSVYLHWLQPRAEAGQEVCYVAGRNDGKMRVRSKGLLGVVGFVSLDPNDSRARERSKRSITEAGIGNMIERFAKAWEEERQLNQSQVRIGEYEYNRRRCMRVETIHPTDANGHFHYYRDVLYFDKETHLPIRVEFYDWPRRQNDPGQLVEVYSFANMRIKVGLGDEVFNH